MDTRPQHLKSHPRRPARPPGSRIGLALSSCEFREMLPPTICFFLGFNLIVLTTNLILADYSVAFAGFILATTGALGRR